jgi:hypothetical protein
MMRYSRSTPSNNLAPSHGRKRGNWLLSLADLVTLLLAFIVVVLTAGRLDSAGFEEIYNTVSGRSGVGIQIAHPLTEERGDIVFLFPEHFQEGGAAVTPYVSNMLKILLKCEAGCPQSLEVMSCTPTAQSGEGAELHESLRQLLTLHRQLFDEELGEGLAGNVRMSVLGRFCEALGFQGENTEAQPVAAIRVVRRNEV